MSSSDAPRGSLLAAKAQSLLSDANVALATRTAPEGDELAIVGDLAGALTLAVLDVAAAIRGD